MFCREERSSKLEFGGRFELDETAILWLELLKMLMDSRLLLLWGLGGTKGSNLIEFLRGIMFEMLSSILVTWR